MRRLGIVTVLVAVVFLVFSRMNIYNDIKRIWFSGYEHSAQVKSIENDLNMTFMGLWYFHVGHPVIIGNKATFNAKCYSESTEKITLGCYEEKSGTIYLYSITDKRLNGIMQLHAAHEMLHLAYSRLSNAERSEVDQMIGRYFATIPESDSIRKVLESYPAGYHSTELHSRIGTEYSNLPADLEEHYTKYFNDRKTIVNFKKSSYAKYYELQNGISKYDKNISSLAIQMSELEKALQGYNEASSIFASTVAKLHDIRSRYDKMVADRKVLTAQKRQLDDAMDNREHPTTTLPPELHLE